MSFPQDDSAFHFIFNENLNQYEGEELDLSFLLSDLQLHSECDTGAGHSAGPEPRIAPSLHHAGH